MGFRGQTPPSTGLSQDAALDGQAWRWSQAAGIYVPFSPTTTASGPRWDTFIVANPPAANYPLTGIPRAQSEQVYRAGTLIFPSRYTVNGSTLTVSGAAGLAAGDELDVHYWTIDTATGATWQLMAPLPAARNALAAVAVAGKIHALGGDYGDSIPVADHTVYNPATNSWIAAVALPVALRLTTAVEYNGLLHIFGGSAAGNVPSSAHYSYDPAASSWAARAAVPVAVSGAGAAVLGDKIVLVGGQIGTSGAASTTAVYLYDPATDSWTAGPALPAARGNAAVCTHDGAVYCVAGQNGSTYTASTFYLEEIGGLWQAGPDAPTARNWPRAASQDGLLHVIGGATSAAVVNGADEALNVTSGEWETLSYLNVRRNAMGIAVVDEQIYVIGGNDGSNKSAVVERFG